MNRHRSDHSQDRQCFQAIAAGSVDALERLYELYHQPVRDFLTSRRHPESAVEDLTQEVFLRVWKQASRFKGESSAKTYLFGIAANVLREHAAKRDRDDRGWPHLAGPSPPATGCSSAFDGLSGPEAAAYARELQEKLADRLAGLPLHHRRAIELAVLEGLSTQEAAAREGCSTEVLRKRLYRAIRSLRSLL